MTQEGIRLILIDAFNVHAQMKGNVRFVADTQAEVMYKLFEKHMNRILEICDEEYPAEERITDIIKYINNEKEK